MAERIAAAAIRLNRLVYHMPPPYRHSDIVAAAFTQGCRGAAVAGQQGFLTNTGRFVDRLEARRIAESANQIVAHRKDAKGVPFKRDHPELFSEDVW